MPLLLSSCSTGKQVIEGMYQYNTDNKVSHEMQLHPNGTFTYSKIYGLSNITETLTGTWKKEGRSLVLNGGVKPPKQKLMVQENSVTDKDTIYIEDFQSYNILSYPLSKDSIYIEVRDSYGSLPLTGVLLNDEQRITTDMQGIAVIGKSAIEKIKIYFLDFNEPDYQVKNPTANHFLITIHLNFTPYIYFENTKVKIKRDELILPYPTLIKDYDRKDSVNTDKRKMKMKRIKM